MKNVRFLDLKAINAVQRSELIDAMTEVLDSGWYINGPRLEQFEARFASFCRVESCVGVGNGLDALSLILRGYLELGRLKEGDEVIVPANTFIATIMAVESCNLIPVLAEPNPVTFNVTAESVEQCLTKKTGALMPVHLYGQLAPMRELNELARENGLLVIEDAAQGHGATHGGMRAGALGNAAGFSFYPGKNLGALGDAGAITTDDSALSEVVRSLRNYGSKEKYRHDYIGVNSRMDELQAAFLSVKLRNLEADIKKRRQIADIYLREITSSDFILPESQQEDPSTHVWHLFVVQHPRRDALQKFLRDQGVETLIHYPIPPHRQDGYAHMFRGNYPITEKLSATVLSLPVSPVMSHDDALEIAALVNTFQ